MNHRRIAAAGSAWLVSIPFGAFIHHAILGGIYAASAAAFRPDPEIVRRLPIGYARATGRIPLRCLDVRPAVLGGRGIVEGLRFGILIGVVLVSFATVWNYVTQPISTVLGVAEAFEYIVASTIYGAIIGAVNGPAVPRSRISGLRN
jgi:hypothetical protein